MIYFEYDKHETMALVYHEASVHKLLIQNQFKFPRAIDHRLCLSSSLHIPMNHVHTLF